MTLTPPFTHPDANCLGSDPNIFFPERGEDTTKALAVCAECPEQCRRACLDHAIVYGEAGIWGGTTGRQRKNLRRTGNPGQPVLAKDRIYAELEAGGGDWVRCDILAARVGYSANTVQKTVVRLRDQGLVEMYRGGYYRAVTA